MPRHLRPPRLRCIYRFDQPYCQAWVVRIIRGAGKVVLQRYFLDDGNRRAALARAIACRDRMVAALPPPRRFHSTSSLNTTGVVGVSLIRQRTRKGTQYYAATWTDERGRQFARCFSIPKYGRRKAFEMAVQARKQALAEMLRPAGTIR
jgi:hypothetical protein